MLKALALAVFAWRRGGSGLGAPTWAPASSATVHPGVQTFTDGAQCTANFVFSDGAERVHRPGRALLRHRRQHDDRRLHAGRCRSARRSRSTGASRPGTMVYNSWLTMQPLGETNPDTCAYNDLALVRLEPGRRRQGQPVDPVLGRPDRRRHAARAAGEKVLHLRQLVAARRRHALSPKQGKSLGDDGNGWSHNVYTVTPGHPR